MLDKRPESNSTPKYFFTSITDITPGDIKAMGCAACAVDVDNTIAYDATYKIFDGVEEWIQSMKSAEIPVMILSNTYEKRAKILAERLDIPYIGKAGKPDAEAYIKAAEMCGVNISQLAMIGDQLFTDIQGANNAGAVSVRVKYVKREILLGLRYRYLRYKENQYLKSKGLGDKI